MKAVQSSEKLSPLDRAKTEMNSYQSRAWWAGAAFSTTEVLLLLATTGTTLAAALKAVPWVTASLGAASVIMASLLKIFDWHDCWISWSIARAELKVAISEYLFTIEHLDQGINADGAQGASLQEQEAEKKLNAKVNELVLSDSQTWATRQRIMADQRKSR